MRESIARCEFVIGRFPSATSIPFPRLVFRATRPYPLSRASIHFSCAEFSKFFPQTFPSLVFPSGGRRGGVPLVGTVFDRSDPVILKSRAVERARGGSTPRSPALVPQINIHRVEPTAPLHTSRTKHTSFFPSLAPLLIAFELNRGPLLTSVKGFLRRYILFERGENSIDRSLLYLSKRKSHENL